MCAETATPFISDFDLHLFNEGTHRRLYDRLGAHITTGGGTRGVHFAVWAPQASRVSVIGDFNDWGHGATSMHPIGNSGVWACFVPGIGEGTAYKFAVQSNLLATTAEKSDPFAFATEVRPRTASIVYDLGRYVWGDQKWLSQRLHSNPLDQPVSIYEVHLGSWMRIPEEGNRFLTYRELASRLASYVKETGFTHVELMPVSEHPLDASWGYQVTGYFAPTSRFGSPDDFRYLIDYLHQNNIGVILDWVPSHFPRDGHALGLFDGSHLYEHADPRLGEHKDWDTYIFNYGRYEVSSFLISNALFWLDRYHIDGLRVDAVASMLYRDYARRNGEWLPNQYGGNENLEAIEFIKKFNESIYCEFPNTMTIAEESTAWPQVSRPTYLGGLGFGFKWDMGWMHDTLEYFELDPIYRKFHHNKLTFRGIYQYSENFVMPLSHDEVVYGKRSLLSKMPGDDWQKFANLRLLFGYMYTLPGKKLLFMGGEFGQRNEWYFEQSLDWHLTSYSPHAGLKRWVRDINLFYRNTRALHEGDCHQWGFEWIDCQDVEQSVLTYLRKSKDGSSVVIACNFTPVPRYDYRVGVPSGGFWKEALNSDAAEYGGSGQGNFGGCWTQAAAVHGRPFSVSLTLPPLGILVLQPGNG